MSTEKTIKTIKTDDGEIIDVYRHREDYCAEEVRIRGIGNIDRVIFTDGKRFFVKWYHEFREIIKDSYGRFVSIGLY